MLPITRFNEGQSDQASGVIVRVSVCFGDREALKGSDRHHYQNYPKVNKNMLPLQQGFYFYLLNHDNHSVISLKSCYLVIILNKDALIRNLCADDDNQ